jgi:serine/threonine protein kinase
MSDQPAKNPSDNLNLIGKLLGQFEILEEIGRGGMATVYRARQSSINRIVAVKVLPPHFLHDPSFFERFEREVDVISHLEHPHILPIYDYGTAEGVPYIAMRYLAGGSMAQMIRRGLPPLSAIEKPFSQIASALDYAHQQGIIHRDLKPGNILFDENGNAYLTDFGIARVLGSDLTGSAIIGTPAYMSPEQANGQPLDGRSDIYALGVVLFELLTGRGPFEAETPMALLFKHISEPMPPVRNFREGVPTSVEGVLAKATSKNPNDRYASAGDMARALREAVQNQYSDAYVPSDEDMPTLMPDAAGLPPTGKSNRSQQMTKASAPTESSDKYPAVKPKDAAAGTSGQPQQRSSLPLILGGVVALAALVIGAALVLPGVLNPQSLVPTPLPTVIPTPFADAQLVDEALYSISMPDDWEFYDESTTDRVVHIWQPDDLSAFAHLTVVEMDAANPPEFDDYAESYAEENYDSQPTLEFIGEDSAPDGTIRRSYRILEPTDPPFPPGQMDVFFRQWGDQISVLALYSSDEQGNEVVPTLQSILDSLRVKA